ncbi:MAG: hypothetical protein ACJ8AW_01450 [Rhodopila sp.]
MAKLVWRVKLVAELQAGVTTEVEVARVERDDQASVADLGLRLAEAKQITAALQAARGLGAGLADTLLADAAVRGLERAKWRLWHGRWPGCRRKLAALCRWAKRQHVRDVAGIGRLERHVSELRGYLERNQGALMHYAAQRQRGEPISTAFVESAVNEIVAKRMNKKQQMRWNRMTVQPFLEVRTAVLNDTLEDAFCRRYSGFRPANDGEVTATVS